MPPIGGRRILAHYVAAFYDGEALAPHERTALDTLAHDILTASAQGWPDNRPTPSTIQDTTTE